MSIIINDKPATDLSTADFDYFLPDEQIAQLQEIEHKRR